MAKIETLHDLFAEELKDLYSAENQLLKALPKMAKASSSDELRSAFQDHLEQTKEHVARLERIGEIHDFSLRGKKCLAMEGLVAEGQETISEDASDDVKDAALIVAAQKVEHYEIAGYGSVRTFAEILGYDEARDLLEQTLDEESAADDRLTEAAGNINAEAAESSDSEQE